MDSSSNNSPQPSVLRLAAPLVISFWMRSAFTFVDTIYASTIGDAAMAAIGLTVPVEFLLIAVWVGLSTGLTSSLSRAMGSGDGPKIAQYLKTGWRLVLLIAPVFMAMGLCIWFLAPGLGLSADVTRNFQIYGTVLIGGSAFTAFWSVIPDSVVKAYHDTRSTMWAGIISNLLNIGLNTLFLFVFHWGIFGIALSTVIGRLGGLGYSLARARYHERRRLERESQSGGQLDPHPYRTVLALVIPSSLTFMLMAGESAIINVLLGNLENAKESIAAFSIYHRVFLFVLTPMIAMAVALLPYAGRHFAQGELSIVRKGLHQAMVASILYAVFLAGPLFYFLAGPIATWLAEVPLTAYYTTFALKIVPLACLTSMPFLLCRPVFEGMGRGRPGLVMAIFRYLALTIPGVWYGASLASDLEQPPLYGILLATILIAVIASSAFYGWLRLVLPKGQRPPAVGQESELTL